jgi:hypothetical protein
LISDLDIYRAANVLIDRHGTDALIEAVQMIDRMLANGDEEGRLVWRRIKRAIESADLAGWVGTLPALGRTERGL